MKADVYNIENKVIDQMDLPDQIFGRPWNADLVHQVLHVQRANARKNIAHSKDRGEVRGGGKKPWRQKHTGRARHGSIRSPLWRGGGVTFGPTNERNFSRSINKKMARAALHAVLSKKLSDSQVKIIDSLQITQPKTKLIAQILQKFTAQSMLLVPVKKNTSVCRASANLPKAKSVNPESLNIYDLLKYQQILIDKEAAGSIK